MIIYRFSTGINLQSWHMPANMNSQESFFFIGSIDAISNCFRGWLVFCILLSTRPTAIATAGDWDWAPATRGSRSKGSGRSFASWTRELWVAKLGSEVDHSGQSDFWHPCRLLVGVVKIWGTKRSTYTPSGSRYRLDLIWYWRTWHFDNSGPTSFDWTDSGGQRSSREGTTDKTFRSEGG